MNAQYDAVVVSPHDIPVTPEELRDYPGTDLAPQLSRSGPVPPDAVRSQMVKILNSRTFERIGRFGKSSAVFGFIVNRRMRGLPTSAYEIATGVLDYPDSFDSRVLSVVRVLLYRLRRKLDRYYASEGAADAVLISFPRGYTADFQWKDHPARPRLRASQVATVRQCYAFLEASHPDAAKAAIIYLPNPRLWGRLELAGGGLC